MPTYYDEVVDGAAGSGGAAYWNARFASLEAGILGNPGTFTPILSWTTLGGSAASITISGIPGTYKVLRLIALLRSTVAAATDTLLIQPNADTTAGNMYIQRAQFTTTTTNSAQTGSGSGLDLSTVLPGSTAPANHFGAILFDIFNYASASLPKQLVWDAYRHSADAAASMMFSCGGGVWKSIAAITSLKFLAVNGSLDVGSAYALYGIG